jgi:hypothetical protein
VARPTISTAFSIPGSDSSEPKPPRSEPLAIAPNRSQVAISPASSSSSSSGFAPLSASTVSSSLSPPKFLAYDSRASFSSTMTSRHTFDSLTGRISGASAMQHAPTNLSFDEHSFQSLPSEGFHSEAMASNASTLNRASSYDLETRTLDSNTSHTSVAAGRRGLLGSTESVSLMPEVANLLALDADLEAQCLTTPDLDDLDAEVCERHSSSINGVFGIHRTHLASIP